MSSTNKTAHLALSQFLGTDKPTFTGDYTHDMAILDALFNVAGEALKAVEADSADSAKAGSALATLLASLAPLNSPQFTGSPAIPLYKMSGVTDYGVQAVQISGGVWSSLGLPVSATIGGALIMVMGINLSGGAQFYALLRVVYGSIVAISSFDNTGLTVQYQMSGLQPQIKVNSGTIQFGMKEWVI